MNGVHKMPSVSQSREPSRCNSCAKNKVLSLGGEVKKNSSKLDGGLSALTFFFFFLSFFDILQAISCIQYELLSKSI